jgi:hypothetical protein
MKGLFFKNQLVRLFLIPFVASLFITIVFYIIYLGFLHPGYAINDDLKIISIVSGYPAGNPAPFLIFSNVLLGFLLTPLYALHTPLNWEMLLFCAINFLSLWVLLYIIHSGSMRSRYKLIGEIIILACANYYALNITFTSTASLACFAGTCLILSGVKSTITLKKKSILCGISLIVLASLIRIQMLAISLACTLPVIIFLTRFLKIRILVAVFIITGVFVFAGYGFDKLFVHANPDWNAYYFYNLTAQQLQDAHRLENLHSQIKRFGWSSNDQELFARWFFPDAGIYSIDRIRYLVEHVPGTSQNAAGSVKNFLSSLVNPTAIPFLLIVVSIWLFIPIWSLPIRPSMALITIFLLCMAENLALVWGYKDPEYVLLSSLANMGIFSVVIFDWLAIGELKLMNSLPLSGFARIINYGFILTLSLAVGMVISQAFAASQNNMNKQIAYQHILADLNRLHLDGEIPQNSLIISPAHGLPLDWSNPFVLAFPSVPYLDTGWITFSPSYNHVLQEYGIQSLPDALYQKNNIYLMTKSTFTVFLGRYYQEHENISVVFQPIYTMPNPLNLATYDNVQLYKVVKQ